MTLGKKRFWELLVKWQLEWLSTNWQWAPSFRQNVGRISLRAADAQHKMPSSRQSDGGDEGDEFDDVVAPQRTSPSVERWTSSAAPPLCIIFVIVLVCSLQEVLVVERLQWPSPDADLYRTVARVLVGGVAGLVALGLWCVHFLNPGEAPSLWSCSKRMLTPLNDFVVVENFENQISHLFTDKIRGGRRGTLGARRDPA